MSSKNRSTRKRSAGSLVSSECPSILIEAGETAPVRMANSQASNAQASEQNASAAGVEILPVRVQTPHRSARPKALAVGLFATLAVLGGSAFWLLQDTAVGSAEAPPEASSAPAAPPAVVSVAAVQRMALSPQSWVSASVHSRSDARLAAEVGGRVLDIAEVGQRLRRGDSLAQLDATALELSVREQQARIGRLQIEAEQAERQLARFRQLGGAGHVSGLQLDEAESRLAGLSAQRREAEAALAQVRLQIEQSRLRAPFDGVVVERFAQGGELLAAGAPLLRLVDIDDLEVRARAPVALASRLNPGTEVELRVQSGDTHRLSLGTVVPVGDEVSRQLELRLSLQGLDLPVGTALELGLPTATARQVLVVPRDAVVLRREGSHVLRVGSESQAERVVVEVGESQGDLIEVRGALEPGERVIVRGAERLREGQVVAVLDEVADSLVAR